MLVDSPSDILSICPSDFDVQALTLRQSNSEDSLYLS